MEQLRAFVAVELPPTTLGKLERIVHELRREKVSGVRWVRPNGIHLTLKFLGNIPGESIHPISQALIRCISLRVPFKLQMGDLGTFPSMQYPKVIWIGLRGALKPLLDLQRSVEHELEGMGFPRERRVFSPHLTLGRVQKDTTTPQRKRIGEVISAPTLVIEENLLIKNLSLMKTTQTSDGATYAQLWTATFGSVY